MDDSELREILRDWLTDDEFNFFGLISGILDWHEVDFQRVEDELAKMIQEDIVKLTWEGRVYLK